MALFRKKVNQREVDENVKKLAEIQQKLDNASQVKKENLDELFSDHPKAMDVTGEISTIKKQEQVVDEEQDKTVSKNVEDFRKTAEFEFGKKRAQEAHEAEHATSVSERAAKLMALPKVPVLTPVESYDYYESAKEKLVQNYTKIDAMNSALSVDDLAVQTHLYLIDKKFVEIEEIGKLVREFVTSIFAALHQQRAVVLTNSIILDTVSYKENILPILISNSKLLLQSNLQAWKTLIPEVTPHKVEIIEAFIVIFENALDNGFEVRLADGVIILRTFDDTKNRITSFFASDEFLKKFVAKEKLERRRDDVIDAQKLAETEKITKESLSRIHHILNIESDEIVIDAKKYQVLEAEAKVKLAEEIERAREKSAQEKAAQEQEAREILARAKKAQQEVATKETAAQKAKVEQMRQAREKAQSEAEKKASEIRKQEIKTAEAEKVRLQKERELATKQREAEKEAQLKARKLELEAKAAKRAAAERARTEQAKIKAVVSTQAVAKPVVKKPSVTKTPAKPVVNPTTPKTVPKRK